MKPPSIAQVLKALAAVLRNNNYSLLVSNLIQSAIESQQQEEAMHKAVKRSMQTKESCISAIKKYGGWVLQYVPKNLLTEEMCIWVISLDKQALRHVPETMLQPLFYLKLLKKCPEMLEHIGKSRLGKPFIEELIAHYHQVHLECQANENNPFKVHFHQPSFFKKLVRQGEFSGSAPLVHFKFESESQGGEPAVTICLK